MTTLSDYRGATTASRQRLQLVGAGALAGAVLLGTAVVVDLLAGASNLWVVAGAATVLVCLGLIAGTSIRMRRLSGRVLGAAVELAALGLAVAVGLGILVLALGRLPDEDEQALVLPAVAAVAAGALLFQPLRSRLVGAARRTSTGVRRSPEEVLQTFGDRSTRGMPVEELLLQLAEALRHTFALATVEIWTGDRDGLGRLLSVPHRAALVSVLGPDDAEVLRRAGVAGDAWLRMWLPALLVGRGQAQLRVAPASHGGELLGLVIAERGPDAERFTEADERTLGELMRRLGVVLHNRQLDSALQASLDDLRRTNDELRASRSRLVAASDAERRRIERDIHDGAQQHLAALAVNLGLAREILADDPGTAAALLQEMAGDVRETIQQVRDLAHGIYPPLLREAGIEEALRAAAARNPLPVRLDAADVPRHDAAVEAAVYFCCLEALQNAVKHAPESAVSVRVWRDAAALRFEVVDDGPGFDRAVTPSGHGFQNMADRLGAIGGLASWTSAPGEGTRVYGEIPVAGR